MTPRLVLMALAAVAIAAGAIALASGADSSPPPPPPPTPAAGEARAVAPQRLVLASPEPGAVAAPARAQISLRGLPANELGRIVVTGARSGRHGGALRAHSDGRGASFVLEEPFEPGEEVDVRSALDVRGADDGEYSFTVARPARAPKPVVRPPRGAGAVLRLRTRPDLTPPAVTVRRRAGRPAPGHLFLAPKRGQGQDGPMIVDNRGRLIWAKALRPGLQAFSFRPQPYRGKPALTWWEGGTNTGVGFGEGVIVDQRYREIHRVRAGNGMQADLHEFQLTDRGTAYVLVYAFVRHDLRAAGGPKNGAVIDCVVQEIDVETGLVVFEWHSLDHIPLRDSMWPKPTKPGEAWDYMHINSVADDADGDLLLSARHAWAVYKVSKRTGAVRWRLGGKDSDFKEQRAGRFSFQHDARRRADGALTVFDNAAGPPAQRDASRSLTLRLDERARTARLLQAFEHPDSRLSNSQGNAQSLPGGGMLVGWGSEPNFTEFDAEGRVVLEGQLAAGNDNYRAYRGEWTGRPATRPVAVAERVSGMTRVTVSWNGATDVARWQVLARGEPLRTVRRRGFETRILVRTRAREVVVRALDADGEGMGRSSAVRVAGR